jgi:hypothetical protein
MRGKAAAELTPVGLARMSAVGCAVGLCVASAATALQAGTLAHWRFEAGPADAEVPHAGGAGAFDGSTPDVSGNGNHLSTWTHGDWAGFAYRTDVPVGSIHEGGTLTNRFSMQNTGAYPAAFTSSADSLPPGTDLEAATPAAFTVEAAYKPEANGGYRTVVGRDGRGVATAHGELSTLYLQVRPDDSARILFVDVSGVVHEAASYPGLVAGFDPGTDPGGAGAGWYRLVAVSDGATLALYVNNVLVASTDMTLSGSPDTALRAGAGSGSDWHGGGWSVGRGLYGGAHVDRAYGFIDEVRISDTALSPDRFLFAPRARCSGLSVLPTMVTGMGHSGHALGPFDVYHGPDLTGHPAGWAPVAHGVFDADGRFAFTTPRSSGQRVGFYLVQARIGPPLAGPLTYQLAHGHEEWPASIRREIVYAMDGAVALYNRHGIFHKHLYANYNPGVPTAQASYDGWIDFGGQRGYRTALHEISHTLGVGTHWSWSSHLGEGGDWIGVHGIRQIRSLDGPAGRITSDGTHFWPYGLNYDQEAGTEANRRHVLMVHAFRRDMGID